MYTLHDAMLQRSLGPEPEVSRYLELANRLRERGFNGASGRSPR